MNMWMMYLVVTLDGFLNTLSGAQVTLGIILGLGGVFLTIAYIPTTVFKTDPESKEICEHLLNKLFPKLWKIFRILLIAEIIVTLLITFIPTTKQTAAIYFVPKVINNKQVRKMPDKLVTLADSWMDEQIKSIKGEKK